MIVISTGRPVEVYPWGSLTWYASKKIGNSDSMTLGWCRIRPDHENTLHMHPNCAEVLTVTEGLILHRFGDEEYEMAEGDSISIPAGTPHNAKNIGPADAVMHISFDDCERKTIPIVIEK